MTRGHLMTGLKKIVSDPFWNILQEIDQLEDNCPIEVFSERFDEGSVGYKDVLEVVHFMKKFDYPVTVQKVAGQAWIKLTGERKPVLFEMSFSNWLSLQAHVPFLKDVEGKSFNQQLKNCLTEVERKYPQYDLSRGFEEEKSLKVVPLARQALLNTMNKALDGREVTLIKLEDQRKYECYPHRMLYIDGDLTFIGEQTCDRCLVSYRFEDIVGIEDERDKDYTSNFSIPEIDDFIYAIRAVTGNEERLVLKIASPEKINLKPEYQFLGNPYMTVNTEGDLIWAASVEVSHKLFSWLKSIKDDIEILDPVELNQKFLEYLEHDDQDYDDNGGQEAA